MAGRVTECKDYADFDMRPAHEWMKDVIHVLCFFASVSVLTGFMLLIAWRINRAAHERQITTRGALESRL